MNKFSSLLIKASIYELLSTAKKVYGPFKRKDNRQIVVVVNDDGSRRTISFPKFIMEQHFGRTLDPDLETVHHIDGDVNNNDISNLEIIDRKTHSAEDTRRVKPITFNCAWCNKEFTRSPRLIRDKAKKGKAGPFCSRHCAGRYSRQLQLKLIDKLDSQPLVDSEYFKRKYVVASSSIALDYLLDVFYDIIEK